MGVTQADVVVIGGGIVGLAVAYRITVRYPERRVVVLEKEAGVARHQTGRNSGVLHAGLYYAPGSAKATTCRTGKAALEAFCADAGVPFEICGKVVVATTEEEVPRLRALADRARANGVACAIVDRDGLRALEPHAAGLVALHVPESGIVDFARVAAAYAERVQAAGSRIVTGARVTALQDTGDVVRLETTAGAFEGGCAVNCAGLYCDRVAALGGRRDAAKIIPFRGEYYTLAPRARHLCRNLIYPVPDPSFPWLGVHLTRMISGDVECGPNAVLAFAREGYRKTDINLRDLSESLAYSGFHRLARRYWRTGIGELWRSYSKTAFVRALQRLVPDLSAEDLTPAPAGVRAQALRPDGTLVEDFLFVESARVVHVLNAPSPAATASLAIGDRIATLLSARWA